MSRWDDTYDGYRMRTLRTSLLVASVMEDIGSGTVTEIHRAYCGSVGQMCRRSIYRYVRALEECGCVESNEVNGIMQFYWVGLQVLAV